MAALALGACHRGPTPDPTGPAVTASTLGTVYLQDGRLPEAEAQFREVIRLIPRAASGYFNLAQVLLSGDRLADAERELEKALRRDSSRIEPHLLLARIYQRTGRADAARRRLESRVGNPPDARVLYARAALAATAEDSVTWLRRAIEAAPANVVPRVDLAMTLTRRGEADSALAQLEDLRQGWAEPPPAAARRFADALRLLRAGAMEESRVALDRFVRLFELTTGYQASRQAIAGLVGPVAGYPVLTLSPIPAAARGPGAIEAAIRFTDATDAVGLPRDSRSAALAAGDLDGDGVDDLVIGDRFFRVEAGSLAQFNPLVGFVTSGAVTAAAIADYDNDGHMDLFLADGGGGHLFRRSGMSGLREATGAGVATETGVRDAMFVDLDHDGDLDLFLATARGNRAYRNNLDGSFSETSDALGLAGGPGRGAGFADLDGDGRIDLYTMPEGGPLAWYRNQGQQRFKDAARTAGLPPEAAGAMAVGDYDNDGSLDLFIAATDGGEAAFYRNAGDGTFALDRRTVPALATGARVIRGAAFLDYDNDGRLDLAAVRSGAGPAIMLVHNDGEGHFTDRSSSLPGGLTDGRALLVLDFDQDGDEDLVLATEQGVRLLRNEGGNANPYVTVQLTALREGSGKNNSFGIGARLELRAGDLFQTRVVTGRLTHFGLGGSQTADALRIEWPNGVPQVMARGLPSEIREADILKGSCAFAYAWDGTAYQLVTDIMWRSALGMPLGIMGSEDAYAPAGASTEYVRIPGSALAARDGRYTLQLTEELWETAYLDQVRLLVVDHPDSVDLFVNERFVPPGPTPLRLYQAARARPPVAATDGEGIDVLPALLRRDDVYVAGLIPTRYQGITLPHDLVLDLGDLAGLDRVYLFLNGWIFPSDASVNVAVGQSSAIKVQPPVLEVRDERGQWRTAVADLGFPAGKRKTIVADLTGQFPTADHRVRIRTTMQVYWDQAFVADAAEGSPVTITTLDPAAADLHYRGFSRTFRKGGRYGPHWFDYADVSTTNPWRPIAGRFTRYGDVRALLHEPDDMYVVMAPGDAATVHFDAAAAPPLPSGWRRDFLLYSDGWIKDSDLNTATGTGVDPLPFHAMRRYPYGPADAFPGDAAHRAYLEEYLTRPVLPATRR